MRVQYQERKKRSSRLLMLIKAANKELKGKLRIEPQPAGMHALEWLEKDPMTERYRNY